MIQRDRLEKLGITLKLPRSANPKRDISGEWVRNTASQTIVDFVRDFDAMKPGGTARLFIGEAEPAIYNHPLVLEAMIRVVKPNKALLAYGKRGMEELESQRLTDALYDYSYLESVLAFLGVDESHVRGRGQNKEYFRQMLGDAFNRFGTALLLSRGFDQAKTRFERSIAFNPRQRLANFNLGITLEVLGYPAEETAEYYRKEIKLNPEHSIAAEKLARLTSR